MAMIWQPLKIESGPKAGKYHYCKFSDEGNPPPFPVGYCAEDCPGHDTPEEARRHYRQFLFDKRLELNHTDEEAQKKCLICGTWTQRRARIPHPFVEEFIICESHETQEALDFLRPLVMGDAPAPEALK